MNFRNSDSHKKIFIYFYFEKLNFQKIIHFSIKTFRNFSHNFGPKSQFSENYFQHIHFNITIIIYNKKAAIQNDGKYM